MKHSLNTKDILALGFMTFALFVGAGNIIFPPMVGIQSGEHVWIAACGFMISAVGLPIMTIIALARVGGKIGTLSSPIGEFGGLLLAAICYLAVGPLFATPRTATVSFEAGISPLTGNSSLPLFIYSLIYFFLVMLVSIYPKKLLSSIGYFLAPIKVIALSILGISTLLRPTTNFFLAIGEYKHAAFSSGFVNGYLTMDTLGALVFGIIIVNAARSRGVQDIVLLTRYTKIAGIIAGIGLTLVYLSLFKLGFSSSTFINQKANGALILHAYVQHIFGNIGSFFLAALLFVACMVTAVGLTCACAEFFAQYLGISYRALVLILSFFSMIVSNLGLNHLIQISVPVLTAIYPPCIVLVMLSFTLNWWRRSACIIIPTMIVSLVFGMIDVMKVMGFKKTLYLLSKYIPLVNQGLSWLIPSFIVFIIAAIVDNIRR
ncbi:branched-chain amino acid transport system II carrier protein [Pantoea sp. Mhis]|uniref:branched-chain amino acid transport system II carrier protein n=1 Tax=Pantoea sp. Mhis TaxID=2576759 RepID=UPI0013575F63|nr:branched-chain amino acid transport system II carrier protein [Pantoea sp. Mhis]MXP56227.1 branched-chain amino acid transport system II carrier protein [Pantoea sp. Mhis]